MYPPTNADFRTAFNQQEDALEILTDAYEQIERMGEKFPLLAAWLSRSLYVLGRFEEAERMAQEAVDAVNDDLGRSAGLGALAKVRAQQGRVDEAERMAREAVEYFAGTDYSTDRTWVLMDLAEVLRSAGRSDEAIATIREALALYEQREDMVSATHARELIDELASSASS
jgi:tetratricopeptide (TPR) repeat protein